VIRFAADENFNNDVIRGLLRRIPDVDMRTVQEAGLSGADDTVVLEWAAREGRVLLTHHVNTITRYANERIEAGLAMPGVFEIARSIPIGRVIEDLAIIAELSLDREWENQVRYLPLR
jgi:hypothetical protein